MALLGPLLDSPLVVYEPRRPEVELMLDVDIVLMEVDIVLDPGANGVTGRDMTLEVAANSI